MKVAIIGGGAAGFFAASNIHNQEIYIFEKDSKPLEKVRLSGGGRCNITNSDIDINSLANYYPRGFKELKQVFHRFNSSDTIKWFEDRGLKLKEEKEGKMFPVSDNSSSVVNLLCKYAEDNGTKIFFNKEVISIIPEGNKFILKFRNELKEYSFDKVIITTGGMNKSSSFNIFSNLKHNIITPVPSLFSIISSDEDLKSIPGISMNNIGLKYSNTKKPITGALLITHQGISGPAMLKMSSFKANEFFQADYKTEIFINWVYDTFKYTSLPLRQNLIEIKLNNLNKSISTNPQYNIPQRLWEVICRHSKIKDELKYNDLSDRLLNSLIENLMNYKLLSIGKTTNKDEFVTAGGVNLKEINFQSMESKFHKGLFFAGEVLNIDGITGGYNFQSAWSTAYISAQSISEDAI